MKERKPNKFYQSRKWKTKRENILKRDGYLCQECRLQDKITPAETVHHINPLEYYPELRLEDKNLISLCINCHNKMHDRETHGLTYIGRKWQYIYTGYSNIIFVIGPPCSGKTTYVRERVGPNDLVFDWDEIAKALTFGRNHDHNPDTHELLRRVRHTFLSFVETNSDFDTVWIVSTRVYDVFHEFALVAPRVVELNTSMEECLARLRANPDDRNEKETEEVIRNYFKYPPSKKI